MIKDENSQLVTLPLVKFLHSDILPNSQLTLNNEDWSAARVAAALDAASLQEDEEQDNNRDAIGVRENYTNGASTSQTLHQHAIMENAARLALCLTRSFAISCEYPGMDPNESCESNLPFPSEPSDFVITLKPSTEGGGGCNFSSDLLMDDSSLSRSSLNCDNGGDFLDDVVLCGECNVAPSRADTTSSSSSVATNNVDGMGGCNYWTILDINAKSKESGEYPTSDPITPMQVLGRLLHCIFSRGKQEVVPSCIASLMKGRDSTTPSNALSQDNVIRGDHDDLSIDDTRRWLKKSLRLSEVTIFSHLVDSKIFPVSVCRLLSDLMTPASENEYPFSSFDQVLQDLERMVQDPSSSLHDKSSHSHGIAGNGIHHVTFGERYFGRKEEVSKIIEIASRMERDMLEFGSVHGTNDTSQVLETVFVSGVAGSGKSHLVREVGNFLCKTTNRWFVMKCKFERDMQYASRWIFSGMFDKLIAYLMQLKESNIPSDANLALQATESIWDAIGGSEESAAVYFDILPSLRKLFGGEFNKSEQTDEKSAHSHWALSEWRLVQFFSKILDTAMKELGRLILICCDDLQWADKASISIIGELLNYAASSRRMSRRFLFIGMHREDEVDFHHPLSIQQSYLQMSRDINTLEIKVPSLSKDEIADMITSHLCLPRRRVINLATVVHHKTSGNAFFVVNLLNSMMRDSTIFYDVQKLCYSWDLDKVNMTQISDGAAGLIASNISSLPIVLRQSLKILSCFGIQTDIHLVELLENQHNGIVASLDGLIELGILDKACGIVIFNHDIIHQEVYESMPEAERLQLHLELGTILDFFISRRCMSKSVMFFAGNSMSSSLLSLACDQVNSAMKIVRNDQQRLKYANWNLKVGKESLSQSNFGAAMHYFSLGIKFLQHDGCWTVNKDLCLELHNLAASSSYALGDAEEAIKYAEMVIEKLPTDDSLEVQAVLLKSLTMLGKHRECISRGIQILHSLGFDLPPSPTKETITAAMADVDRIVSKLSVENISSMGAMAIGDKYHTIANVLVSFHVSSFTAASPFLPLAACAMIKYTQKHGICQGSTSAFATYGQFKIFLEDNYSEGKRYADIVRAITKKHNLDKAPHLVLMNSIDVYFDTPNALSKNMLSYSKQQEEIGEMNNSMIALGAAWRFLIYGGENLSLINKSMADRTEKIAKRSKFAAKFDLLDTMLVKELIGPSSSSYDHDMECLRLEAEADKDKRLLYRVHVFKMMISYWKGDFAAAEESSNIASTVFPVSNLPSIQIIYFAYFRGLTLFQRYSEDGGANRLKDAKHTIDRMGVWANNAMHIFGNKWYLLQAEYEASTKAEYSEHAEQLYKKSIEFAQDHGIIHELGTAHELLGSYYAVHEREDDYIQHIKRAYVCYSQWGATAISMKLLHDHDITIDSETERKLQISNDRKHPRGRDTEMS